jgi:sec-independent protein translocase protein TatC
MAARLLLRRRQRPSPDAMTLVEHLEELRRRLIVSVLAFVVAAVVAFVGYGQILHLLEEPYCRVTHPCRLYVTGPLDGLSLRVKIAGYGGAFLASPVVLFELWRFVTPGLHAHERRYAVSFALAGIACFGAGVALAYVTFPHALRFLDSVGGPTLKQIYNPNAYLALILALMAVFGITFEFPVVLVGLQLAGIVRPSTLAAGRRWAIFLIVLVAAVITPSGDPFSMMALAVPLYAFYELAIVLGRVLRKGSTEPAS